MLTRRLVCAALLPLLLAITAPRSNATSITLTVKEPSGVARINDPVTSGVPITTADTSSNVSWSLFDGSTEIPVQTKALFGVRTPWLLLDFQASVGASATKTYTLISQTPSVTPSPALVINDTPADSITVVTGPLKVKIGKNPFNLFDGVWLDRNHDGVFDAGTNPSEKLVDVTSNDNLPLVLPGPSGDVTGVGRRAPISWSWEDRGPLRATLRVDGYYTVSTDTAAALYFTDRITFHAGQTYVTVDHLIRNSFDASLRYVKVKSARLLTPGSNPATGRIRRSGDRVWIYPVGGAASFEMLPDSLIYTKAYSTPTETRTQDTIQVSSNNGMIMADWSHHSARARFDFSDTTLSGSEPGNRRTRYLDYLVAQASQSWYSDRGAFGAENFGTYDDEKTANQNWNWNWPNTTPSPLQGTNFSCLSYEQNPPRPPTDKPIKHPGWTYYPSWTNTSNTDLESDMPWINLLMYGRTGLRSYLDRGERWTRYFTQERTYRTDGFAFHTNPRTRTNLPTGVTLTPVDTAYIFYNTTYVRDNNVGYSGGRGESSWLWNGGLIDYYYLTGDREALAAAVDVAEFVKNMFTNYSITQLSGGASLRSYARPYLTFLRTWEATNATQWRERSDYVRRMFFYANSYDARGFYFTPDSLLPPPANTLWAGGKYVSPFQMAIASQALYRDWVLTSNGSTTDSLALRLKALADFAYTYGSQPDSGYTGDDMVIDYPSSNKFLHLSYSMLREGKSSPPPNSWNSFHTSSASFEDALTIGYRLTGSTCYLSRARMMWERASKWVSWASGTYYLRIADNSNVGRFMHAMECGDGRDLPEDELGGMNLYFHDAAQVSADYVPPAAVSNLSAELIGRAVAVLWTAPGDDGTTGQAAAYDLRYSTSPITLPNFPSATPMITSTPQAAGNQECADAILPTCGNYYFAIRTRDECNNWSDLSNVVLGSKDCTPGHIGNGCGDYLRAALPKSDDEEAPRVLEFTLAGRNPVLGPSIVSFGIPRPMAGQPLEISIFDLAGRRVGNLYSGPARAGRFRVPWNQSAIMPSGAYFLTLRLGEEARARKLVVIR